MSETFLYAVDKRFVLMWAPFGLHPSKDGVTLTDDRRFTASFGFVHFETPLDNVAEAHVTTHYRWYTAIGVRGSMVDDGLSFGTNTAGGVCVHFHEKVPSRIRPSGHSALTVTVADLTGLVAALETPSADGIP